MSNSAMINRESRDQLSLALRRLACGLITNDEYDDALAQFSHRRDDPALAELAVYGWLHYSDLRTYRLRGRHRLSREERRSIARALLFLKTDQEYVHGDSLVSGTVLGNQGLRVYPITVGLAITAGAFACFALHTILFGFMAALVIACVGYLLLLVVVAAVAGVRRRRWKHDAPRIHGTFWPCIDDRASSEQLRYWPFANRAAYETALANPPFLCGRRSDS